MNLKADSIEEFKLIAHQTQNESLVTKNEVKDKVVKCNVCGKIYENVSNLKVNKIFKICLKNN